MLRIESSNYLDKVYLHNVQIGYLYLHTGINRWVFESSYDGLIGFTAVNRDDVIENLFVRWLEKWK